MSNPLGIGLVGFGAHVRKNLLPVIDDNITRRITKIFVRDANKYKVGYPEYSNRFTGDFNDLLVDTDCRVILIATPIATHFEYAEAALLSGKHVWCEKVATESSQKTNRLIAVANDRHLLFGEVIMYQHHLQFDMLKQKMKEFELQGQSLLSAKASFTIPSLPVGDFRYDRLQGGGALLDVGFYPLSIASGLFGIPNNISSFGKVDDRLNVDIYGSAMLDYGHFPFHAFWSIGGSYSNSLELCFSDNRLMVEKPFSKANTLETTISIWNRFGQLDEDKIVPPDDHFANMFDHFQLLMLEDNDKERSRAHENASIRSNIIHSIYNGIYNNNKMMS